MKHAALVYQAGIANVFETDANFQPLARLLQSDFRTCEAFARGLAAAGVEIDTFHCNEAGDITGRVWSQDLDAAPFSESFRPVYG